MFLDLAPKMYFSIPASNDRRIFSTAKGHRVEFFVRQMWIRDSTQYAQEIKFLNQKRRGIHGVVTVDDDKVSIGAVKFTGTSRLRLQADSVMLNPNPLIVGAEWNWKGKVLRPIGGWWFERFERHHGRILSGKTINVMGQSFNTFKVMRSIQRGCLGLTREEEQIEWIVKNFGAIQFETRVTFKIFGIPLGRAQVEEFKLTEVYGTPVPRN